MYTLKFLKNRSITDSKVLQFLSHPKALQVRLRTRTINFCNFGVEPPKRIHQLIGPLDLQESIAIRLPNSPIAWSYESN